MYIYRPEFKWTWERDEDNNIEGGYIELGGCDGLDVTVYHRPRARKYKWAWTSLYSSGSCKTMREAINNAQKHVLEELEQHFLTKDKAL